METAWDDMVDCRRETGRVPQLLERVEREDDAEAWRELGYRLVLEHDLVSPAGFAALPRLVRLAPRSAEARALAGEIVERAAGPHGRDDLLAACAGAIADLRDLLVQHLRTRPDDFLTSLRALLATVGEYHWAAVLGDFVDDFYAVNCPHCDAEVTVAIGDHGRYSAIRDWDLGDVRRRDLRPAARDELTGTGRWMYETAVQAGREKVAEGIAYLFGRAECPLCGSVFGVADEYTGANRPVVR